jgi:hypothetical protein
MLRKLSIVAALVLATAAATTAPAPAIDIYTLCNCDNCSLGEGPATCWDPRAAQATSCVRWWDAHSEECAV